MLQEPRGASAVALATGSMTNRTEQTKVSLMNTTIRTLGDHDAGPLEQADKDAAVHAARHRHHPAVKALGTLSEVADQMPLSLVCGGVI